MMAIPMYLSLERFRMKIETQAPPKSPLLLVYPMQCAQCNVNERRLPIFEQSKFIKMPYQTTSLLAHMPFANYPPKISAEIIVIG